MNLKQFAFRLTVGGVALVYVLATSPADALNRAHGMYPGRAPRYVGTVAPSYL